MLEIKPLNSNVFNPDISHLICIHTYTISELYKFHDYFVGYDDPPSPIITKLLYATIHFLAATTVDPYFSSLRNKTMDAEKANEILNNMARALQDAKTALKSTTENEVLLKDAIAYVEAAIRLQIESLKSENDVIYIHHWQNSLLQQLLQR